MQENRKYSLSASSVYQFGGWLAPVLTERFKLKKIWLTLACLLVVCLTVLVSGCSDDQVDDPDNPNGDTSAFSPEIRYATQFSLEAVGNGCELLTDGEDQQILLVPEGATAPAAYANLPRIQTPVKNVVILSTTYAGYMRALGVLDAIKGVTTEAADWYIDSIKTGLENGSIQYLGGSGMGAPNYEEVQALQPDVVLTYISSSTDVEIYETLKTLGLPVVISNESLENHPLGRLEHVKLVASLFNLDQEAEEFFDQSEEQIQTIINKVSNQLDSPTVIWASLWMGTVYAAADDSYVGALMKLAGGQYLFPEIRGVGSPGISLEELYARGKNADVFVYPSWPPWIGSLEDIIDAAPILADIQPMLSGDVWCYQAWWWQSGDKLPEMVKDLAAIFYPDLFPGYTVQHLLKLPAHPAG